jgi:hypothetical protein
MAFFFRDRAASGRRKDAALRLTMEARAILAVDDDAVVSVSEHACGDPACGGAQTVILVMCPDRPTEALRIGKPVETVTRADVVAALATAVAANGTSGSRPKRRRRARRARSDAH